MVSSATSVVPAHVREAIAQLLKRGEITQRQHEEGLRLAQESWFIDRFLAIRDEPDAERRSEELDRLLGPKGTKASEGARQASTLEQLGETIPKVRRGFGLYLLVVLWSVSPLIPIPGFKAVVLSALSVLIVHLLLDLFKQSTAKIEALTTRFNTAFAEVERQYYLDRKELLRGLYTIDTHLREPTPPTFADFNAALPVLKSQIIERLKAGKSVQLRLLAISAQFSWKHLILDAMDTYLGDVGKTQTIDIQIVVVSSRTLEKWGQDTLRIHKDAMDRGVTVFRKKYRDQISNGAISLRVEEYDNIPHWHGIMIDDDMLFLGRTRWKSGDPPWELTVGQNVYRQFVMLDRFNGTERIDQFKNWFDAYLDRARHLTTPKEDQAPVA
jgi:hypothetical protein